MSLLLAAAQAALAVAAPQEAEVDRLFARWGAATPGCAVAVAQGGRIVLDRAYGMADLEHGVANTPATRFEAGSVAKQFTAAAILILAEEGRLALTDDVRRFVPELPDYGAPITIEHLLTHTSGLRDWGVVAAIGGWPRGEAAYTQADALAIITRQRGLNHAPGAEYSYTNSGYTLLAMIVERAGGAPLAAFTRDRLFRPLGMAATEWRDDYRRIVRGRAIAYERAGEGFLQAMPFEHAYGNGGLITTTNDLIAWNEAIASSRLGAFVTRELQRVPTLSTGRTITYARGIVVDRYRGLRELSHSGATGGYRSWLGFYPEQRVSVAMLCNAGDADRGVARGIADHYLPPAPVAAPVAARFADAEGRAGMFADERTGNVVRLEADSRSLRAAGGRRLRPLDSNRLETPSGVAQFEGRDGFSLLGPEGDSTTYRRVLAWRPDAAALAAVVGDYRSDEANAGYRATLENAVLTLAHATRPMRRYALSPLYQDVFAFDGGIVRLHRDGTGRIEAIGIGSPRVRDLRFARR